MKFKSGLANCHIPGLYSLVISERESPTVGMKRVFYAGGDCNMELWDGADFTIKPHNHRQNIKLTRLFGRVDNVSLKSPSIGFQRDDDVHTWKYKFGSALLGGKFDLERMEDYWWSLKTAQIDDQGIHLHWSDVHTVVAAPQSAWLVEEFDQAPAGTERCYSVSNHLELSSEGLYDVLSQERLAFISRIFAGY